MDESRRDEGPRPIPRSVGRSPVPVIGAAETIPGDRPNEATPVVPSPAARIGPSLHICGQCKSHLVQATQWQEITDEGWQLQLDCPNCRWRHRGTFSSVALAALEDQLDGGFDMLLRDLKRLTQANMTEEIERFAAALAMELILPEDF